MAQAQPSEQVVQAGPGITPVGAGTEGVRSSGSIEGEQRTLGEERLAALSEIATVSLFGQESVKRLSSSDFDLHTDHPITLKAKGCVIALFYSENTESKNLIKIWALAAQQVAGPIFGACNLLVEREVAAAFSNLNLTNSSLRSYALKVIPFILSYQNGWPVGFYNGERAVQPIIDYVLTLACKADYFEPLQIPAGMQAETNYEMTGWKEYKPVRTDSLQYKVNSPIRGYDPRQPITLAGTEASREEAAEVTASTPTAAVEGAGGQLETAQQALQSFAPQGPQTVQPGPQGPQTVQPGNQSVPGVAQQLGVSNPGSQNVEVSPIP